MFDPTTMVGFHTWLSLVGIATGIWAVAGLTGGRLAPVWTEIFLATAVLTSVTGYLLPAAMILPSHIVGAIALVVLAIGLFALYIRQLAGGARWIYAVCAVISLYLLVFVAVAQTFAKVPAAHALAPTGTEPAFAIAQAVVLAIFVFVGFRAVRGFRHTVLLPA